MAYTCILKQRFDGVYEAVKCNVEIENLFCFLEDETSFGGTSWIELLNEKNDNEMSGNATYIRKENNRAYVGWSVCHEDPYPDPNEEEFDPQELINGIKAWVATKALKPDKIIIEVSDGKISVRGEGFSKNKDVH